MAKKIGVLTSGGDAPGMNAAVRAVCRAGLACELRNKYRFQARELMEDQKARKTLDQTEPIISFEDLVSNKMVRKNMSREEAIADTLKTAVKTRRSVDKRYGLDDQQ